MLKALEELRILECAEVATPPRCFFLKNSHGEHLAEEIERITDPNGAVYTLNDLSEEARKILKI